MIARLGGALAALLLVAACGGDDGGRFDEQVAQVRQAVAAGDRDAAATSLEELRASAFAAHSDGELGDEELFELNGLVDQARADLDEELPEVTTTTEAPTTTEPAASVLDVRPEPGGDEDKDEGKGKDDEKEKGKDHDDDDGGDDDD